LLLVALQDAESDVRSFMSQGGFDLPVLLDPSGSIGGSYGVTGVPTAVFIDGQGRIRSQTVGGTTEAGMEAAVAALRG
jgi:AhpC/TSA family